MTSFRGDILQHSPTWTSPTLAMVHLNIFRNFSPAPIAEWSERRERMLGVMGSNPLNIVEIFNLIRRTFFPTMGDFFVKLSIAVLVLATFFFYN